MKSPLLLLLALGLNGIVTAQTRIAADSRYIFTEPDKEKNCMQYFNYNESDMSPVNAFFLAKMSEMMYPERLYYQLRYLQNGQRPVTSIASTDWIERNSTVTNTNFETAFAMRFAHYFFDEARWPRQLNLNVAIQPVNSNLTANRVSPTIVQQRLDTSTGRMEPKPATPARDFQADSIAWVRENTALFKFIRQRNGMKFLGFEAGYDPELMVIAAPRANFVVFRGTDNYREIGNKGEWLGTDFAALFKDGISPLNGTKLHSGFYESYLLIKNELVNFLNANGGKTKKTWLSGHSLGSAVAVIAAVDLKAAGYNIQAVYGFSAPRVLGNDAFRDKGNAILPNRIHRFEYYLDPVTVVGVPFYHAPGKRHWFDEAEYGNMQKYTTTEDRYLSPNPCEFNRCPNDTRTEDQVRILKARKSGMLTDFIGYPTQLNGSHHNPQYMLRGIYKLLSATDKNRLPDIDDSFPYLYGRGPSDPPIAGSK